jgi:uncharacterized membrane protein YozB (DUF420 family)
MTIAELGNLLARVNAILNATSFLLLVTGYVQIRRKRVDLHRKCMKLAFLTSAIFLASYVTRFALTGSHRIDATGGLKAAYFVILGTHMVLAMATVPLALRALYLAYKGRFAEHRRVAKWTFPIWAYVSITGVVVYVLLYHVAGIAPG